jgi:SAM-dependent methyltransferase
LNRAELIETWKQEEQRPFAGWDFAYLKGRMIEERPPWDYMARAAELMRCAASVLDMGTGGGERLLSLREYWPAKVAVTEEYPPNVTLARERLGSLGVRVEDVELSRTALMPFADGEFDLVLNRHSSLNCAEVARVLAPGGVFLTQQVHGLWAQDLLAEFGATPLWPDSAPEYYIPRLEAAGLVIENAADWQGKLAFNDVGAVVYYLKAVPWLVPGFSVATHLECLQRLQQRLEAGQELAFEARLYWIEAHKPGGNGE